MLFLSHPEFIVHLCIGWRHDSHPKQLVSFRSSFFCGTILCSAVSYCSVSLHSNCSTIFSSHQIWQFALPCTRQFLCCSNIFTSGYPTLKAVIIRLVAWVIDLGCGFKAFHLNILAGYTCSIHTNKAIWYCERLTVGRLSDQSISYPIRLWHVLIFPAPQWKSNSLHWKIPLQVNDWG